MRLGLALGLMIGCASQASAQAVMIDAAPCLDKQAFERLSCLNNQIDDAQGKARLPMPAIKGPELLGLFHPKFTGVDLVPAGEIEFAGPRLREGKMRIFCASSGYAYALLHDAVIAVNGSSASYRHGGGRARLSDGRVTDILTTDRRDLERAAIVKKGAEPLVYNELFAQALAAAKKRCDA